MEVNIKVREGFPFKFLTIHHKADSQFCFFFFFNLKGIIFLVIGLAVGGDAKKGIFCVGRRRWPKPHAPPSTTLLWSRV